MHEQHTPGPWFVFGNGHCVGGPCDRPPTNTGGIAMCSMQVRTPAEIAANARLIAAAPDLLGVCRAFVEDREDCGVDLNDPDDPLARIFRLAELAIRKAEGEQPCE